MRELLIKIRAILEGAGLKQAADGQKDLAKATQEATPDADPLDRVAPRQLCRMAEREMAASTA